MNEKKENDIDINLFEVDIEEVIARSNARERILADNFYFPEFFTNALKEVQAKKMIWLTEIDSPSVLEKFAIAILQDHLYRKGIREKGK
jgi:hypothetical protein